jgi:UDP-N-acetyl-D-mannosaminuronic acid dehydrogenase
VRQDYPRMQSFPRPGFAAGPCLVKDTIQLGAFHQGSFPLGQAALSINEGLPWLLVQQLKEKYPLRQMTVGVLGMAFKPNCDDPRDSLSYKLRRVLQLQSRRVLCTDPYVPDPQLEPLDKVLNEADLIVVATPHDCYRDLKCKQPVFDISQTVSSTGEWQAVLNGYVERSGSLDGFYRFDGATGASNGHSNGHQNGHIPQASLDSIDYVI